MMFFCLCRASRSLIVDSVRNQRESVFNNSKHDGGSFGQATKGSRWIPWHTEAMKDVVTCDKSRGAGNTL